MFLILATDEEKREALGTTKGSVPATPTGSTAGKGLLAVTAEKHQVIPQP